MVEAVLGLLLSCCLLLPSAMMVMQNPRVDNILLGYDALFYDRVQRYGLILQSLFFPPDIPPGPTSSRKATPGGPQSAPTCPCSP